MLIRLATSIALSTLRLEECYLNRCRLIAGSLGAAAAGTGLIFGLPEA